MKAVEDSDDNEEGKGEFESFNNQRLLTPRMRKLMNNRDAREVLQEEINESTLRLKQAKFGHSLIDIAPKHETQFYLPDKRKYVAPKEEKKASTSQLDGRSVMSTHRPQRSNTNMSRDYGQLSPELSGKKLDALFLTEPLSALSNPSP